VVDTEPVELVEDALEWVWWWWCIDRTEDTEDEVDFRPLKPADERRTVPRGVNGDGDNDWRL
jgi:hypothetical protein